MHTIKIKNINKKSYISIGYIFLAEFIVDYACNYYMEKIPFLKHSLMYDNGCFSLKANNSKALQKLNIQVPKNNIHL